ncbi:MAG TPA: hypothetical protein VF717_09270 [Pyrinomonadaceae bacterium]|jgi:phage protein D
MSEGLLNVPHYVVEINDVTFDSWRHPGLLTLVSAEMARDKTGGANISMCDPAFKYTDMFLDTTGLKRARVRVWLGYGEQVAQGQPLFEGLLSCHRHDGQVATFSFDDPTSKMKQKKRPRYHNRTTALKLLKKLAEENGLSLVVKGEVPDSEEYDVIIQWNQTDWQLAMETARDLGLRLYARGQTLYAQEAGKAGDKAVAELVYKGTDGDFRMLRGLGLSHKLPEHKRGRHGRVEVRTRGRAGRRVSGVDTEGGARGTEEVQAIDDLPSSSERAARRRARARRNRHREQAFEHSIILMPGFLRRGLPILQGHTVKLMQVGLFYSGLYVVDAVSYQGRPNGLTAELSLNRDIKGVKRGKVIR